MQNEAYPADRKGQHGMGKEDDYFSAVDNARAVATGGNEGGGAGNGNL